MTAPTTPEPDEIVPQERPKPEGQPPERPDPTPDEGTDDTEG